LYFRDRRFRAPLQPPSKADYLDQEQSSGFKSNDNTSAPTRVAPIATYRFDLSA